MKAEQYAATRPRDRRTQVFACALDLFWQRGFDGVTIADVGAAAGISAGAIYRHVPNKQELLAEPIREMVVSWYASALIAVDGDRSPAEALQRLAAAVVVVAVDRPKVVGMWHRESRHLPYAFREELVGLRSRTIGLWADRLRQVRPDLCKETAEFRIRAALGLLNSIPLLPKSISRARLRVLLEQLVQAVVLAPGGVHLGDSMRRRHDRCAPNGADSPRREALLQTGAQLFREYGYRRVGIGQIAAEVGIRGPSVYSWFPSKAELLFELLNQMADNLDAMIESALETASDPRRRVAALARGYVELSLAHRDLVAVYAAEIQHLPEDRRRVLQRRRQSRTRVWVRELRAARPDLPDTLARVVVLASLEMVFAIVRSHRYEQAKGVEVLTEMLLLTVLLDT